MLLNIRTMTRDDKQAVMQLLRDTPEFEPAEVAVAEEVLESYLRDPAGSGYYVTVAERGPAVAGYVCYGPTPLTQGTWDIYWIAVAGKERGQGMGKALLAVAEDQIRQDEGRLAVIETSSKPAYEDTHRFYQAQGYQMACRIADFYEPGDDLLVFVKRLT